MEIHSLDNERGCYASNRYFAEFFGTFWLVFGGCGSAVLAAAFPELGIGFAGVALAFGPTVLTMPGLIDDVFASIGQNIGFNYNDFTATGEVNGNTANGLSTFFADQYSLIANSGAGAASNNFLPFRIIEDFTLNGAYDQLARFVEGLNNPMFADALEGLRSQAQAQANAKTAEAARVEAEAARDAALLERLGRDKSVVKASSRDLAAAFAPAREVFQEVDEVLKQKLSKLMFEGPGEELTLDDVAAETAVDRRGPLQVGIVGLVDAPLHVRLAGADPHLADEHVVDDDGVRPDQLAELVARPARVGFRLLARLLREALFLGVDLLLARLHALAALGDARLVGLVEHARGVFMDRADGALGRDDAPIHRRARTRGRG